MSDPFVITERQLPDNRTIVVHHLTFGRARLSIGPTGEQWFEDGW